MLPYKHTTFALSEEDKGAYDTLLDISGTGVMGYIEIPTINISLPVYHGTEDAVLQIAVGHWNGQAFLWEERIRTVFCPGIGGFRAQSSLRILISWWWETNSSCVCWTKC